MLPSSRFFPMCLVALLVLLSVFASPASAETRNYTFVIQEATYTRLCNNTKTMLTVNGSYPGPTITARRGDIVYVKVINEGYKNISIHWHGVNEPRNPWSDGPEYITQCPIQPGGNFTQRIELVDEEGTLWWHAHSEFDRATIHGAIIVQPKLNTSFPFPSPDKEFTLILGEWWNDNITEIYDLAVLTGREFDSSNASTINGQPGDLAPCSSNDTFKVEVEQGKRYLLRVINSAISNEFFFAVGGHNVTVVGSDAAYTKPYVTDYIMITPGQTFDLLLEANKYSNLSAPYRYYIYARPFSDGNIEGFLPNLNDSSHSTVAILEYKTNGTLPAVTPVSPSLPSTKDTSAAATFVAGLRSLASPQHPVNVPKTVDVQMYITLAVNFQCLDASCISRQIAASLNNASFQAPKINILDAYYGSISGVYTPDFPNQPPLFFNFTDNIPSSSPLVYVDKSTKVKVLEYNQTVEIVFQGTNLLGGENHPMHLHGHSFYVVGRGVGIFNSTTDPLSYNLIDPPYENTVGVPKNGWVAIRFWAANPGVWFMHCHLDRHTVWGMDAVFITKDGNSTDAKMFPPPADRPPC